MSTESISNAERALLQMAQVRQLMIRAYLAALREVAIGESGGFDSTDEAMAKEEAEHWIKTLRNG